MDEFKTSSFCGANGCVEVAQAPTGVTVRGTRDRTRELEFSNEEWATFVAGVKNGEFDVEPQ